MTFPESNFWSWRWGMHVELFLPPSLDFMFRSCPWKFRVGASSCSPEHLLHLSLHGCPCHWRAPAASGNSCKCFITLAPHLQVWYLVWCPSWIVWKSLNQRTEVVLMTRDGNLEDAQRCRLPRALYGPFFNFGHWHERGLPPTHRFMSYMTTSVEGRPRRDTYNYMLGNLAK